jgi:phosphoribosylamine--glycine ligase
MDPLNVLLIGGGGREHAMAWKLAQSDNLRKLFISPGNPGTSSHGENVDLDLNNFTAILDFVKNNHIELVVIGPEQPLVDGLTDFLEEEHISVFGPSKEAAQLEGSKEFAKEFMYEFDIPTAAYNVYSSDEFDLALNSIVERDSYPVVLKADGLAAGKGVFICEDAGQVKLHLETLKNDISFSKAANRLVVEEFMHGEEASVFVISDGFTAKVLQNAQDHKRAGDGDTGLNTGGMGAYCPAPVLTPEIIEAVENEIISPTITGMQVRGSAYKGILYVGLMITDEGPKVVEYNCRFGDPECQVILPALKNDLLTLMYRCSEQRLNEIDIEIDNDFRCCVVMASNGYPGSYEKFKPIHGIDNVDDQTIVFHAGTAVSSGKLLSNGGRVLNVVGKGNTLQNAIDNTYANVKKISFENAYYRNDIGAKGLKYYS